jgi:transposase
MSMRPVPLPDPDPVIAAAIRKKYARREPPLAVAMRDHLGAWMQDEDFAEAFGSRGRRGESPAMLAMVLVLKHAEGKTDREAAEAVRTDLDWLYALGLPLDDEGFDFSVLSEFRERLAGHGMEEKVLDALLSKLQEDGLVKPGGKQRTDSTHVLANARELHAFELITESVRAALEALAASCPGWLTSRICVSDWERRYGLRTASWSSPRPKSRTKRDELAVARAADGYALVSACYEDSAPPWARDIPAVQVLRTVLVQNFTVTTDDQGREVTIRREHGQETGVPPAHLRIESPYDPGARRGAKDDFTWLGYKLHITETCDGPPACGCPGDGARCPHDVRPNLITHAATTDATVADVTMTLPIARDLHEKNRAPARQYEDSGYASARNILDAAGLYGITLITPLARDPSRQAREGNGYDRASFTVDYDARTVTCPQGQATTRWSQTADRGRTVINVEFPAAACRACPARPQCTTSQKRGRTMKLPERELYEIQAAARADQDSKDWWQDYQRRAGCEATMSQAIAATGIRRTRYRGLAKVHLDHCLSAAAVNVIRLCAYWSGTPISRTGNRTSRLSMLAQQDQALAA